MIPAWYLLVALAAGWVFVITAVALGGYMVFRTKRESWEPMFRGGPNQGDVIADTELDIHGPGVTPEDLNRWIAGEPRVGPHLADRQAAEDSLRHIQEKFTGPISREVMERASRAVREKGAKDA